MNGLLPPSDLSDMTMVPKYTTCAWDSYDVSLYLVSSPLSPEPSVGSSVVAIAELATKAGA